MEKLIDLKQEWGKWKCPDGGKLRDIEIEAHCPLCDDETEMITEEVNLCDYCQIENFVTFARNEGGN